MNAQETEEAELRAADARATHGFVGFLTTCVCYVLFLVCAFTPEHVLVSLGVTYFPAKWWALALPAWGVAAIGYAYVAYEGVCALGVPPPHALSSVTDPAARFGDEHLLATGEVLDEPLSLVCHRLFGVAKNEA